MHGAISLTKKSITERALVIVRKGRKRKNGKRHACGKLIQEDKFDPKIIAMRHPDRQEVKADLRYDAKAGNVMGRLQLCGKISPEQYEAGVWYAGVVNRYRQVILAPSANPKSIAGALAVGGGGAAHIEDDEAKRRKAVYDSAFEVLDAIGQRVAKAVAHTAINDRLADGDVLRLLVMGLEALAIHRGLTRAVR